MQEAPISDYQQHSHHILQKRACGEEWLQGLEGESGETETAWAAGRLLP